jgi:glutathione-regulated potassium-efflux system ancillary protein KefC
MTEVWGLAALWFGLAVVATLCAIWFRVSPALTEIIVGTLAQLILGALFGPAVLGTTTPWTTFLASAGAIGLTFLAGAELDPVVFRRNWKEATALGLVGFFAPFFGCAAVAYWILGWGVPQSWLAGIALSGTSVAVVYAVMLEYGFNRTEYGKIVLAACFINDLGTVLALGFIFAPFSLNTALFAAVAVAVFSALPWITPILFNLYGGRPSEFETIPPTALVRARRNRRMGRQRSGAPRLHRRHVACGDGRQRSRPDSPHPYFDSRPDDAVLFHPRWVVCVGPGTDCRADRLPRAAIR